MICRRSVKRDAMLDLLRSTDCHPSADWVFQQLRPVYPDLSLGTVYRNLNQLCEHGLIKRVGTVNGQERYDADLHPHAHFVCTRCGSVTDLPLSPPAQGYVEECSKQFGFEAESYEVRVKGLCQACKKFETVKEISS